MLGKKHGHGKHMLWMMIGCLASILLIVGLRSFNIGGESFIRGSYWLFFLLCPLMHIFMMKGMMKGDHKACDDHQEDNKNKQLKS